MDRGQIIEVLTAWQHRLGLNGWTIAVTWPDKNPEVNGHPCHMKILSSTFYMRATLEVGLTSLDVESMPDCIEKDVIANGIMTHDHYVEVSLVHELLHLALRDIMRTAELVDQEIHPNVRTLLEDTRQRSEEATVEAIAQALVQNWQLDHTTP